MDLGSGIEIGNFYAEERSRDDVVASFIDKGISPSIECKLLWALQFLF